MAHPLSPDALRRRIDRATLPGATPATRERARRLLQAWLETALAHRATGRQIARALRDGTAARAVAEARRSQIDADPPPELRARDCAAGCAWCCILTGEDGGTITEVEARALHGALATHAHEPDGRNWHPAACPALDPKTRLCRAYGNRPALCNAYISTDVAACRTNADGGAAPGGGVLGSHPDYLAVIALSRNALKGIAMVQTYSLREVAAAAIDGKDVGTALSEARHRPRMLDDVRAGAEVAAYSTSSATTSPSGPTRT